MFEDAPAFTIRIRPQDSESAFVFEGVGGHKVSVGSRETFRQAVFEQGTGLRAMLEDLRQIGGGTLQLELSQTDVFLQKLFHVGQLVLDGILGNDTGSRAADLSDLTEASMAAALATGRTPWIHVVTADNDEIAHAIPFELIPFMSRRPPPSVAADETRLAEALDGFLGFSAVVRRDRGDTLPSAVLARSARGVPVKLFQNLSLVNAKAEMDYFRSNASFDPDEPWPEEALTAEAFSATLLRHVFDPRMLMDGSRRDVPDQIHHFACHCDTFGSATGHNLMLEGPDGRAMTMQLTTLRSKFVEIARNRERVDCDMPLVFLNACGATAVDPLQIGSFVKFFLDNLNRGLIGAQIMIPSQFAAAFSEMFYTELAFNGLTVGEAMLRARRKLAERKKNPLGVLYMHYGQSALRVAA